MKPLKLLFFLCATSVFAQVPANDECANAEPITIPTASALTITVDFTEATESLDASCNIESADNKDLWYEFTMPIDGVLRIDNTSVQNYFTIYETCGGAEIICTQDNSSISSLVNGNAYLLRTSFQFNANGTFSLQAIAPVANDECINPETITISTTNFTQPNPDSSFATESLSASCDTSNKTYLDVWYAFVMPVNGTIGVTFTNSTQTFALYDSCSGTELQCFSNFGLFQNLNENATYILRVAERTEDAGAMNFRLQAYEYAANDECVNSQNILIETASSNTYQTDLRTATESIDASCETASNTNYDLWYNFTMPVTGNLKIDQLTGLDSATIYDSCGGTEISCQSGLQFVNGLIEGTNYTVRIASISPANKQPRFQAFPLAANDECATSETISVVTENFIEYTVNTRTATESLDSSCDTASDTNLDLWFDIVMPVSGNLQLSGVSFQFRSSLYDACSGTELDCSNGNNTYENLALNTNYKLRVSQRANDANTVTFRLQAFENIFNDECVTPQDITIIENEFSTYATNNAAASNSTISNCEPSSENLTVLDVWYRFIMPSNNDIEIEHLNDALNGYYALYDACGTTELQCFTDDGFFNGLTAGNEYLLKVGNLSSQSGILSFNISAKAETLSTVSLSTETVSMYPNPVQDVLHLSSGNQAIVNNAAIYNVSGQLLKTIVNTAMTNQIAIYVSDLKSALYFIVITSNKSQITRRIVKQ